VFDVCEVLSRLLEAYSELSLKLEKTRHMRSLAPPSDV
jgi:hypothetical protein